MGWGFALILYVLPILVGLRHFDEAVEDAKDWMREEGVWYPTLAPILAIFALVIWPVSMAIECIDGKGER